MVARRVSGVVGLIGITCLVGYWCFGSGLGFYDQPHFVRKDYLKELLAKANTLKRVPLGETLL